MNLRHVQNAFFLGLVVLATGAFLGLVHSFLQPVFWAAVLATTFHSLHRWWLQRLEGWPSAAALASELTIVFIVILPLFGIGAAVAQEATEVYQRIAAGEWDMQAPIRFAEQLLPVATEYLNEWGLNPETLKQRLSNAAVSVSRRVASEAWTVGQNAARFTLSFSLMLYLLFFFLRDGRDILDYVATALPLGANREQRLFSKFAEVARATLKGTIVVGIVQGTLGGVIFWVLGIDAAVLWGVVMTLLSFLPAVGAAVVWVPAAALLLLAGKMAKGLILIGFGALIIGLVDNVLRPVLVGRDTQMPDYLILLSTLGGIALFGVSGFVIGPIIAALFLTVWQMLGEEYDVTDEQASPEPAAEASAPRPDARAAKTMASEGEASESEAPAETTSGASRAVPEAPPRPDRPR